MIVSSGFCAAGWLLIYFAEVLVFIAEIATKDLRGALTTINQLIICTGVSVSFILGTLLIWRALALVGLANWWYGPHCEIEVCKKVAG
ncbi:sugar transporter ERD6-like 7 [Salvia miltiorrhiza]|uniref:sugar transporter ERD6-like 7 n=1 Tax=Salvia miltiorrhiza TaxID=226208 RepID=UPI0025ACBB01|nr:sugar transporter ERD6-like 7 [Salvia miltiorrhiza]